MSVKPTHPLYSLRTGFMLAFVGISLLGTLLALGVVRYSTELALDALVLAQNQAAFSETARTYYQTHGSWRGVREAMRRPGPVPGPGATPPPVPFALVDVDGRVLLPGGSYHADDVVAPEALARGTALTGEGGRVIGTVLVFPGPVQRGPAEQNYSNAIQSVLLISTGVAVVVALGLGWWMARALARPLQELAAASRALARGGDAPRVPVRTRDELGELAAAFNQMSADLASANAQRRQMTADIAHELRSPLSVLGGYIEAMRDGTLAATPERLDRMYLEVQQLTRLVSDLRTLSLADTGELLLQREAVEPLALLRRVESSYALPAEQKGVTLAVQAGADLPEIEIDPERMVQVLGNLVSNALRYTPAGGRITLAAAPGPAQVLLSVQDTGAGIAPEDLPHIFDRFYRGDKARQQREGESGLGLAIARALVLAHGGAIRAESEVGRGTGFEIALPC